MRIVSFSVFREKLLSGEKRQTIRRPRKVPFRKGELVQVVWKSRSKNRELLFIAKITDIRDLVFDEIDEKIAIDDGFESLNVLQEWFKKKYPTISPNDEFKIIKFEKIKGIDSFLQKENSGKKVCRHDPIFHERKCPCKFMESDGCLFDKIAALAMESNFRMFRRRSRMFRNKNKIK